jgi:hypothetical protein
MARSEKRAKEVGIRKSIIPAIIDQPVSSESFGGIICLFIAVVIVLYLLDGF